MTSIILDKGRIQKISTESCSCRSDPRSRGGVYIIKVYFDLEEGELFYRGYTDLYNQWTDFSPKDVILAATITKPTSAKQIEQKVLDGISEELEYRKEFCI